MTLSSPNSRLAEYLVAGKAFGVMFRSGRPRLFAMLRAAMETATSQRGPAQGGQRRHTAVLVAQEEGVLLGSAVDGPHSSYGELQPACPTCGSAFGVPRDTSQKSQAGAGIWPPAEGSGREEGSATGRACCRSRASGAGASAGVRSLWRGMGGVAAGCTGSCCAGEGGPDMLLVRENTAFDDNTGLQRAARCVVGCAEGGAVEGRRRRELLLSINHSHGEATKHPLPHPTPRATGPTDLGDQDHIEPVMCAQSDATMSFS